jgi:hypothetical protein
MDGNRSDSNDLSIRYPKKKIISSWLLNCVAMGTLAFAEPMTTSPGLLALPQNEEIAGRAKPDPRVRQYIAPKRIVWESNDKESTVENAAHLLRTGSAQVMVVNPQGCNLKTKANRPVYCWISVASCTAACR